MNIEYQGFNITIIWLEFRSVFIDANKLIVYIPNGYEAPFREQIFLCTK